MATPKFAIGHHFSGGKRLGLSLRGVHFQMSFSQRLNGYTTLRQMQRAAHPDRPVAVGRGNRKF